MLKIRADIGFSVAVPQRTDRRGTRRRTVVDGRVEADGNVVFIHFSQLPCLITPSAFGQGRQVARFLDDLGLRVCIVGPDDGVIVELGRGVTGPTWLSLLVRTRSIRVRSLRDVLDSRRGPQVLSIALPRLRASLPRRLFA